MNTDFSSLDRAIANFDIDSGDKFALVNDTLVITEGGFTQSFIRTYRDMTEGGYNLEAVAQYLISVADKLDEAVREALDDYSPVDFTAARETDDRRVLRNRIAHLYKITQDIELVSGPIMEKIDGKYFQELRTRYFEQLQDLNVHLEITKNKDISNRYVYDPEITPQETEEKLAKIIAANPPTWKKVALTILERISLIFPGLPLVVLTWIKKVTWNPVEWCLRGRVTTGDPIKWWTDYTQLTTWGTLKELKQGIRVGELARALLHNPVITEEHVEAYKKIAESGLDSSESFNLTYNSKTMTVDTYHNLVDAACLNTRCRTIYARLYPMDASKEQIDQFEQMPAKHGFTLRGYFAREVPEASDYDLLKSIDSVLNIAMVAAPLILGAIFLNMDDS